MSNAAAKHAKVITNSNFLPVASIITDANTKSLEGYPKDNIDILYHWVEEATSLSIHAWAVFVAPGSPIWAPGKNLASLTPPCSRANIESSIGKIESFIPSEYLAVSITGEERTYIDKQESSARHVKDSIL